MKTIQACICFLLIWFASGITFEGFKIDDYLFILVGILLGFIGCKLLFKLILNNN